MPSSSANSICDFSLEAAREFSHQSIVCGLDEVGRGPLAGPVVAACVYIPPEKRDLEFIKLIKDSKKLSENKRTLLFSDIMTHCHVGVAECSPTEIDELNILWASMEAMSRALTNMLANMEGNAFVANGFALVDGNRLPPDMPCPAQSVVKGDAKSKSIAAASIIAKVTRDRYMAEIAAAHPYYGWKNNSAYPTKQHLEAIAKHGITPHHRKSFGPVRRYLEGN